jgi:hypothetical protein
MVNYVVYLSLFLVGWWRVDRNLVPLFIDVFPYIIWNWFFVKSNSLLYNELLWLVYTSQAEELFLY